MTLGKQGELRKMKAERVRMTTRTIIGGVTLLSIVALAVGGWARSRAGIPQVPESEASALLKNLLPEASTKERIEAIKSIGRSHDKRFIAPLIDVMRFLRTQDEYQAMLKTLDVLTGENVAAWRAPLDDLIVWYGNHEEQLQPPPEYSGWKGELIAEAVDPRFREFLYNREKSTVEVEEVVWGGVRVDGIPALVNPKMIAAEEAHYLQANEPVFGVSINGDNRAYPLRIMDWHEMADDVVGGEPVALAYCTLCGAGVLFDARASGFSFVFGSSGLLFRSNKLMYDQGTHTLWNQLTGEPVIGTLAGSGTKLRVLPVVLTSWSKWKDEHPETKVLDIHTGYDRLYMLGASYGEYFSSPGTMFPVWRQSGALPKKARVFALQLNGNAKAYSLDALNDAGGVLNDTVAGENLVIYYESAAGRIALPASWQKMMMKLKHREITAANQLTYDLVSHALAKEPKLSREISAEFLLAMPTEQRLKTLTSYAPQAKRGNSAPEGEIAPDLRNEVALRGLAGETRAYDRGRHRFERMDEGRGLKDETGQAWKVTETSLDGPGRVHLPRVAGHLAYWFGWFAFFPRTELYGGTVATKE
jgi:hypothetical protein